MRDRDIAQSVAVEVSYRPAVRPRVSRHRDRGAEREVAISRYDVQRGGLFTEDHVTRPVVVHVRDNRKGCDRLDDGPRRTKGARSRAGQHHECGSDLRDDIRAPVVIEVTNCDRLS
jgi:hypothetical protein